VEARRVLGELVGSEVSYAAVPFGSYDRRVLANLRRTGVTRVYTSDGGQARAGAWLQPRTSLRADDGPDWAQRVMIDTPSVARRARAGIVRTIKRLRG
jgi:hypothetical protein